MAKNKIYVDGDLLAFPSASQAEDRVYIAKDPSGKTIAEFSSASQYKSWIEGIEFFGIDTDYGWQGSIDEITREFITRPKSLDHAKKAFERTLEEWLSACPSGDVMVYLAPMSGQTNFRHDVALRKPYKGNRVGAYKPHYLQELREWAFTLPYTKRATKFESDDLVVGMSTRAGRSGYQVQNEKDGLNSTNCWVYYPDIHLEPIWSDPDSLGYLEWLNGDKKLSGLGHCHFAMQQICGDQADFYTGIDGVGPKKAFEVVSQFSNESVKHLPELMCEVAMLYKEKYGDEYSYVDKNGNPAVASWFDFYVETTRLAYMLRHRKDYPNIYIDPVKEML